MTAPPRTIRPGAGQRGFTLFTGLIILLVMTLVALTAFRIGASQTMIVANAEHHNEGVDSAQQAIDVVVNSSNFTLNPAAAIPTSNCSNGGANSWCVDTNGDGIMDFTVTLAPQPACIEAAPIPVNQLDLTLATDLACVVQTGQNAGGSAGVSTTSLCSNSMWEIAAQASDPATGTAVTVVQGVTVRIPTTSVANYCP